MSELKRMIKKNWSRMSHLTKIKKKSELQSTELSCRIDIHNNFPGWSENETINMLNWIDTKIISKNGK